MAFKLLDFEALLKFLSAKYLYRNFKYFKMIDNNVTEGNYVLVFRNIVFTICYKQITYLIYFRTPLNAIKNTFFFLRKLSPCLRPKKGNNSRVTFSH